jgi:hypothetical protein
MNIGGRDSEAQRQAGLTTDPLIKGGWQLLGQEWLALADRSNGFSGVTAWPFSLRSIMNKPSGHIEIRVDGSPAPIAHRGDGDRSRRHLKQQHPHSEVRVKDLRSGEVTLATWKPAAAGDLESGR